MIDVHDVATRIIDASRSPVPHLPKRVKYWAVIHVGAHVTTQVDPNLIVPEVKFMEVLELAEGHPRS